MTWFLRRGRGQQAVVLVAASVGMIVASLVISASIPSGPNLSVAAAMWAGAALLGVLAALSLGPRPLQRRDGLAWLSIGTYAVAFVLPAVSANDSFTALFPDRVIPGWFAFAFGWIVYPAATTANLAFLLGLHRYLRESFRGAAVFAAVAIVLASQAYFGITWAPGALESLPLGLGFYVWVAAPGILLAAALQRASVSRTAAIAATAVSGSKPLRDRRA